MKKRLQVGDRVAVYGCHEDSGMAWGLSPTVQNISPNGTLKVLIDGGVLEPKYVHAKSCRRLIPPKERRSVWVNPAYIPQELGMCTVSVGNVMITSSGPIEGWPEFREVKRKGGGG